jgi:hypothetical protein
VVQLVDLNVTESWGVSDPFFPGGIKTGGYTPDRLVSDVHAFKVHDWAPPYVGRLSVQMLDSSTGEPLLLANGADRLLLSPLIRIDDDGPRVENALDYRLGDAVELRCASLYTEDDTLWIDLYWRTHGTLSGDYTVMVHGLDSSGAMIEQNDAPPLDNDYPTSAWRSGQTLADRHSLPANPDLAGVAIGLYDNSGRLPVTLGSERIPDDQIILPIKQRSCLR